MQLVIGIDPGETTGFVVFEGETGKVISAGAYDRVGLLQTLQSFLSTGNVEQVVYERFQLYGGKVGASKSYSDLPEVRVIGSITTLCEMYHAPVDSLGAGVYKSATEKWVSPKDKITGRHMRDAWRLGTWYLVVRMKRHVELLLKSGRRYDLSIPEGKEITNG